MRKYLSLGFIVLLTILFSGCGSNEVTLQIPKYDEISKTVDIDGFKLKDVVFRDIKEGRPASDLTFANSIKWYDERIKFNDKVCPYIKNKIQTSSSDKYFTYSRIDDVRKYYDNKCKEERLYDTNIIFVECPNSTYVKENDDEEYLKAEVIYGIVQSSTKRNGYGTKVSIGFADNKECFELYKKYLKDRFAPKK